MRKIILTICCAVLFVGGNVFAEEKNKINLDITADFFSKYIWRGQTLDEDPVFQPGLNISWGNLTAIVWGSNLKLTDYNGKSWDFIEVDLGLDYSDEIPGCESVGYSIGFVHYDYYPHTLIPDTIEIYAGLNFDLPLNPSITANFDVDEADGTYLVLGLSHSIEQITQISEDMPVGIEISASLGWGNDSYNAYYWGVNESNLNDLTLSLAFSMELLGFTVVPSLNYATIVDGDVRSTSAYGDNHNFFSGIRLVKRF